MKKTHLFFDPDQIKILIVDDEAPIQKLLDKTMRSAGYETCLASNGDEAFDILTASFFDIVITDIAMPKMDGFELTKRIRAHFPSDVIVMTGQIDQYTYNQSVGIGASDFVSKPFTPAEILLRVERILKERKLKEELLKFHRELAQAQKLEAIGQLTSGIVHEINTPLQFVADNVHFIKDSLKEFTAAMENLKKFYASELRKNLAPGLTEKVNSLDMENLEYLGKELPGAADQALEGISRINNIIKAMKSFSHPGRKEHVGVNINRCINDAVTISRHEWKYIATLVLDLDENLPPIMGDPGELNQVLVNMIVNASHAIAEILKSVPSKMGKIEIQTRKNKDWIQIRISDTGMGIPKDLMSKIFDPFFTTKEMGKGTGQGLSISHSIVVARHKGTIDVNSSVNEGTSFLIKLPIQ